MQITTLDDLKSARGGPRSDGRQFCSCAVIARVRKESEGTIEFLFGHKLYDKGFGHPVWGTAGGKIDDGESVFDGSLREIHEEIGISNPITIRLLGCVLGANPKYEVVTVLYRLPDDVEPRVMEPDVMDRWEWMTLDELAVQEEPFVNQHVLDLIRATSVNDLIA